MSLVQDIFARSMPAALAAQMEAEARASIARCPCGYAASTWERGTLRWGAAEKPQQLMKCPRCLAFTMHSVTRR